MPDVGVLNLQIQDNSSKAAEGLDRLATALHRVKQAVGGGLKLGPIANQIKKLNDAVAKAIPEQSLANLERFANAIEKLNAAGGIKLGGLKDMARPMDVNSAAASIKEQVETAVGDGFVSKSSREQETAVADLATSVKETVAETTEAIEKVGESTHQVVEQTARSAESTVQQSLEKMGEVAKESTGHIKMFNPATGNFEDTQYKSIREEIEDFDKRRQESEVQWREQTLSAARELFANSSREVQEAVAHIHGMKVDDLFPKDELQESASTVQETAEAVQQLDSAVEPAQTTMKGFGTSVFDAKKELENLKKGIPKAISLFTSLASQFARVAKYRMLRAVLKQITEGFKEGVENYYRYSQAIGNSFAPAMDSAATALLQMKNSIGAAVAPLIQALIPYLQMAVSWFVNLLNYATQFLSLMRGQSTWSRATQKSAKAFDDVKKSAKGAAASIKDLLADWDELNIIQSESGGNGGGGGSTKSMQDYLGMFEEVSEFDKNIRAVVDNIKKHFGSVLDLVKEIGIAVLAWKVSSSFAGLLGGLASLIAAGAIISLTFKISQVMTDTYFDTGNVGWLVGDVLTTMLGGVLAKKVLSKVLGGAVAKVAIPLTFALSAIATIKTLLGRTDVSVLSQESIGAAITAGLKGGTAAGYLYHLAGYSLGASLGGGLGMAAVTFGVAIGLKAIAQVAEDGKLTAEALKADLLSAGVLGAGLTLTEVALGGTLGTAIALGGGAALLTFGALVAIQAVIAETNRSTLQWGNYEATKEEIQAFVQEQIFDGAAPKVKLSLANAKFEELGQSKTDLENQMSEVLGELHVVSIGLKDSAESDIRTKVSDLITTFNTTAQNYQESLQLAVSLVPVRGEDGKDTSDEILKNSKERWDDLSSIMTGLAHDLTQAFDTAYNKDLDEATRNTAKASIEKISGMMTQVADAIASGQAKAKASMALSKRLSELTHGSMDELLEEYRKQRDELIKELTQTSTDAAEGLLAQQYAYEKLAEYALKEAGGDTTDETYQEYIAKAKAAEKEYAEIMDDVVGDATAAADKALSDSQGVKDIRKALLEKTFADLNLDPHSLMVSADWGAAAPDFYGSLFREMIEGQDLEEAKGWMREGIVNLLKNAVGADNVGTYLDYIDAGILSFGDFFSKELLDTLADSMGIADGEARTVWDSIINDLLGIGEEQANGTEGIGMEVPITFHPVYDVDTPEGALDVETETEDPLITGKKPWTTSQLTGHAGASSGVRYADNTSVAGGDTAVVVTMDAEQQKGNIQSGVQTGTSQLLQVLQSLKDTADAINRKDFTVNITPTTMFGRMASMATGKFDAVTGNGP